MKQKYIVRIIGCIIIGVLLVQYVFFNHKTEKKLVTPIVIRQISSTPPIVKAFNTMKTLFIPYWTLSKEKIDDRNYDQLVYFGITINKDGIDTKEDGYRAMDQFLSTTDLKKKRLLGVRMINTDINIQVLHDTGLQHTIISQSIQIAKEKGFDGIVLDFEISALGFDNVTKKISDFEIHFAQSVKQQHLQFFATMYGDTFFRARPFAVRNIADSSDGIMIMAYDFHKANGEPGPNFQLHDLQGDGYDFETMIHDFLGQVSPEKVTVIFGLFGYDWTINAKGNNLSQAVSLSENQIKQRFLNTCMFTDCRVNKDSTSGEANILYTDSKGNSHVVWFEDMNSAGKKTEFLKSKGIGSIAYWAYSYF